HPEEATAVSAQAPDVDVSNTSTESLAQALRLLLSVTGRSVGSSAPSSTQTLLASLLESRATGHADEGPARLLARSDAEAAGSSSSISGGGRSGAGVDPESVSRFVAAVSDAIRANAENAPATQSKAQKTLDAYTSFIVRDLVSVEKMLSPGMQQLVAGLGQGSSPAPTASELVDELTRQHDAFAKELRSRLEAVDGRICVSIGTSCISGALHYLAVFAHWVDAGFEPHSELLDCHCFDGAPTSGDIISMFEGTLTQYNLFAKLGTVTTKYTRDFVEFLNQVETICHARGVAFDLDRNQATCI
ncbi:hypothetical protein J3B02_006445, partial [Coemansia erecta]